MPVGLGGSIVAVDFSHVERGKVRLISRSAQTLSWASLALSQ
jgi:hypothetical protein